MVNINRYKNLIFDLGNVIINIDFNKTFSAFSELTDFPPSEIQKKLQELRLFDIHGNGDLDDPSFRAQLRKLLHKEEVSDDAIDKAFNALLLDIPHERIELLKRLRSKYRLFLLSNTNYIHIKKVNEILYDTSGINNLDQLFDKVYYSHELKLSKPDIRIYHKVLEENNLLPEETLFLDDVKENIEGAISAGISGVIVTRENSINIILKDA